MDYILFIKHATFLIVHLSSQHLYGDIDTVICGVEFIWELALTMSSTYGNEFPYVFTGVVWFGLRFCRMEEIFFLLLLVDRHERWVVKPVTVKPDMINIWQNGDETHVLSAMGFVFEAMKQHRNRIGSQQKEGYVMDVFDEEFNFYDTRPWQYNKDNLIFACLPVSEFSNKILFLFRKQLLKQKKKNQFSNWNTYENVNRQLKF